MVLDSACVDYTPTAPGNNAAFVGEGEARECAASPQCSGNQLQPSQALEHVEEGVITGLIGQEAQPAALGHIRHHFDGPAKVGVGVPG